MLTQGVRPIKTEGDEVSANPRYGIFKVMVDCSHCGNPVVTNGPLSRVTCPSCLQTVSLPPDLWSGIIGDYLADYGKFEPGSGTDGTLMTGGLTVKFSCIRLPPPDPACPTCEENWDLKSVENGADRVLVCGKCGRTTPVYPAPSWLSGVVPSAKQVFFADREMQETDAVDKGARPIALTCPQCGGGIVVTADSDRTIPCKYCGVDVYLPDGVWLKLHPAKVAKFWMVRFEG